MLVLNNLWNRGLDYIDAEASYNNYRNTLKQFTNNDISTKETVDTLHTLGILDRAEYKKAISLIDDFEKTTNNNKATLGDVMYSFAHTSKTHKEVNELYSLLADKIPAFYDNTKPLVDNIFNAVSGNVPSIASIPAPEYSDINFEGKQIPVDPIRVWTGQELADLHNINYNPDDYFDLIKQGTSAAVNYADYQSKQLNNASMIQDQNKVVSYLDSIRNNKAEALSNGATAGAKAAGELLANTDTLNNYATEQAKVAQERYSTASKALQADAQAALTARDYFNNLATTLGQDIASIYYNDADFQGQQYLTNADLYVADQALRGSLAYNNAQMEAAYRQNKAIADNARSSVSGTQNDYAWIYDNFLKTNNNDPLAALNKFTSMLYNNSN